MKPILESSTAHRRRRRFNPLWLVPIVVVLVFLSVGIDRAFGATSRASWYGPGLYGNPLACGGRLSTSTWGVAHKSYRCGTRVQFCYGYRCTTATVVDRGPFVYGRDWDLTAPVARYLCGCYEWGVRLVAWRIR